MPLFDIETDSALLEKSIRQGCSTVMVHSRPHDEGHRQIYELLGDLAGLEEIDLENFSIGHCINTTSDVNSSMKELIDMCKLLPTKKLDFVCMTLPHDVVSDAELRDQFLKDVESVRKEMMLDTSCMGLHIPSSLLADISQDRLESLQSFVENSEDSFGRYALATNYFTHSAVSSLRDSITNMSQKSIVMACDVLRLHKQRPGLLNLPAKFSIHHNTMKMASMSGNGPEKTQNTSDSSLQQELTNSIDNFKMAMDRCVHVERKYMQNIAPTATEIAITDVCWAHVLSQTQESFRGPEEWEYALKHSIEPKLEDALNALRKQSKEASEFTTLYSALSKHLFSVFLHLHQVRRLQMCTEVVEKLRQEIPIDSTAYSLLETAGMSKASKNGITIQAAEEVCTKLSQVAVVLSACVSEPDVVLVSGTEIVLDQLDHLKQNSKDVTASQANSAFTKALLPVISNFN